MEEVVDRAALPRLVEHECPTHQRLHQVLIGCQFRVVFGNRDGGAPRVCGPVQERHVRLSQLADGCLRVLLELGAEVGDIDLDTLKQKEP